MAESLNQLKESFVEETRELINELENILLAIDDDSIESEIIDRIFRIVHTIKGSGGMLGYENILSMTHGLEDIYDQVRSNKMEFSADLKDVSLETIDVLKFLILDDQNLDKDQRIRFDAVCSKIKKLGGKERKSESKSTTSKSEEEHELPARTYYLKYVPQKNLPDFISDPAFLIEEVSLMGQSVVFSLDTFDFAKNKFEGLSPKTKWIVLFSTHEPYASILEIFDMIQYDADIEIEEIADFDLFENKQAVEELEGLSKEVFRKKAEDFRAIVAKYVVTPTEGDHHSTNNAHLTNQSSGTSEQIIKSIRVSTEQIDHLLNLVSEMVTLQARLNLLSENIKNTELEAVVEKYASFSKQLRDNAYSISLVPFGIALTRYKRLVHDLSLQLGKKIDFVTEGDDTVLDKKIIESLSDPIMHILRNCADHGIESPEERKASGKPETGTVHMNVFHKSNNVHIQISDDGGGIDPVKIRKAAIEKGVIEPSQMLSDKELINLIFVPGFSSKKKVSNVSGRGVGLDVVKKNISDIRGFVEVDTKIGEGTTFTIVLPLTLSIIDGLRVRIEDRDFIIPLMQVDKILTVDHFTSEGRLNQFLEYEGRQIPYFNLRKDFDIQGEAPDRQEVVLVSYDKAQIALVVDYVVGENQTVLKPMGRHYKYQDFISGCTILGDGSVALVFDINKIVIEFSKNK